MNLLKRTEGVFSNPKPVFESLAEKPVWIDALVVILLAVLVFGVLVTPYSRQDQLQLFQNNIKMKERLGEERFKTMIAGLEKPIETRDYLTTGLTAPVMTAVLALIQSLLLLIFGRFFSTQGRFVQVLSAYLHANFIDKLLGNAVRLALVLTRKSVMQTSTGLPLLFPKLEVTSPSYLILAQFDFFQLWTYGVLALGLAAVFKIEVKKALFLSYSFWFLKAIINFAIAFFSMRLYS